MPAGPAPAANVVADWEKPPDDPGLNNPCGKIEPKDWGIPPRHPIEEVIDNQQHHSRVEECARRSWRAFRKSSRKAKDGKGNSPACISANQKMRLLAGDY